MSTEGKTPAEGGPPAYVTRFDRARVPATDHGHPLWLDSLADDVTIEGSAMNGVAHGAEAVRSMVTSERPSQARQANGPLPFAGSFAGHVSDRRGWWTQGLRRNVSSGDAAFLYRR